MKQGYLQKYVVTTIDSQPAHAIDCRLCSLSEPLLSSECVSPGSRGVFVRTFARTPALHCGNTRASSPLSNGKTSRSEPIIVNSYEDGDTLVLYSKDRPIVEVGDNTFICRNSAGMPGLEG